MKSYKLQTGLTLVETLVAVTIVAVLVSVVISVAVRIESKAKEQLADGTVALLNMALKQYEEYGYQFNFRSGLSDEERDFYLGLKFPPDCNDYTDNDLKVIIEDFLDQAGNVDINGGTHNKEYSGCEALYFFLSRIPECRQTLEKIDRSLLVAGGLGNEPNQIDIDEQTYPLMRIVDPWGTTLKYDYYEDKTPPYSSTDIEDMTETIRNFPLITSAGPDRHFDTPDDLTNRIKTKGTEKL